MYWLLDSNKKREIQTTVKDITDLTMSANINPWPLCKNAYIFSGRKSSDIANKVLSYLTQNCGESKEFRVYDPFMGSGTIVYEALRNGCRIDAGDLDNYAYYLVDSFLKPLNKDRIIGLFDELEGEIKQTIMNLYTTECCGEKNYIKRLYFDLNPPEFCTPTPHAYISDGKNVVMSHRCPRCKSKKKAFKDIDKQRIESIDMSGHRFPAHKLVINSRINITAGKSDHYDCFFTKRSQLALSLLQEEILKREECEEREFLQLALVAGLHLMKITDYKSKSQDLYHIPDKKCLERNVWLYFEDRFTKVMKFRFDDSGIAGILKNNSKKVNICNSSYEDFPISNDSVDLVFSEPTYSDLVPYLERNQLFRDWLYFWTHDEKWVFSEYMKRKEVVITNSPERNNKGWAEFYSSLDEVFCHFSKKLRVHGYCILFFRTGQNRWMEMVNKLKLSARKVGFEPIHRIAYSKDDPTMRYLWSSNWSITSDSLIFFLKLDENERYHYENNIWLDKLVYTTLQNHIEKRGTLQFIQAINVMTKMAKSEGLKNFYLNPDLIQFLINRYFDILPNQTIIPKIGITVFEDFRKETIQNRILDWVPRVIDDLLKKKRQFNYNDFIFALSLYLDNGDKEAIDELEDDRGFIINVLKNYVEETPGGFRRKKVTLPAVAKNKTSLHSLSGKDFELLVQEVLEREGYRDIVVVGRSGDNGVDIEAKDYASRVIIQCKNWKHNVGSNPIQRLHSYKLSRHKDKAICITTSGFTREGKKEAEKTKVELISGEEIRVMIERSFPQKYY